MHNLNEFKLQFNKYYPHVSKSYELFQIVFLSFTRGQKHGVLTDVFFFLSGDKQRFKKCLYV